MVVELRPFHPSDLPAMYRVCLLTGAAGQDATGRYRNPDLLGHVYCGPYPVADPGLAFVVADDDGPAGYVLGTADTLAFEEWQERRWWPVLRAQHPLVADPHDGTEDHVLVEHLHRSHARPDPLYEQYPAHLHVDLLPRLQGQGWGRRLIERLVEELRERRVPGVHLGVSTRNPGALAFYERLGFARLRAEEGSLTLGLDLR